MVKRRRLLPKPHMDHAVGNDQNGGHKDSSNCSFSCGGLGGVCSRLPRIFLECRRDQHG